MGYQTHISGKNKNGWTRRAASDTKDKPLNIYEVHLGSWMRKEIAKDENGEDIYWFLSFIITENWL